jgi:hypothetical protein
LQLLSPSNIVDRLSFIPWRHGTHDKLWDTTTITSLRKVEVEEEVEEKVEVEVGVCRRRRRRRRGGGLRRHLKTIVLIPTQSLRIPTYPPFLKVHAHRPWCPLV